MSFLQPVNKVNKQKYSFDNILLVIFFSDTAFLTSNFFLMQKQV